MFCRVLAMLGLNMPMLGPGLAGDACMKEYARVPVIAFEQLQDLDVQEKLLHQIDWDSVWRH